MDGVAYVKRVMRPLSPVPTVMEPKLAKLGGISTVIFDVYGTLLISAAGDIGMPGRDELGRQAMAGVSGLLGDAFAGSEGLVATELVSLLENALSERRAGGSIFPEVDIRLVWKALLERYAPEYSETRIDEAALLYECHLNPVWEMPGSCDLIQYLATNKITMGIISNAQNYIHSVFEGVMGGSFEALGIDSELMAFSYVEKEGKPSLTLYQKMKTLINERGAAPESVLYVGNDMIKDVIPASKIGFRTCLFAGDNRSLRLGALSCDEVRSVADVIVTSMNQIPELLE